MNKAQVYNETGEERRKNCPYRHENGNCVPVGGFCTAVTSKYCLMENGGKKCGTDFDKG